MEDKVKKLSDRSVRIIIALNDCGRFRPACVICSKSCMTLLISSLVEQGWIHVCKALWNKLNYLANLVVPKRNLNFSQRALDTEGQVV